MGDFSKMKKIANQIVVTDISTANYMTVDIWDCVTDISKFPIPRKGDLVNFYCKEQNTCVDYKVTEVKYAYKHFNGNLLKDETTVVYITIYVKRI